MPPPRASRGRSAGGLALDPLDALIGGAMERLEETGRQMGRRWARWTGTPHAAWR